MPPPEIWILILSFIPIAEFIRFKTRLVNRQFDTMIKILMQKSPNKLLIWMNIPRKAIPRVKGKSRSRKIAKKLTPDEISDISMKYSFLGYREGDIVDIPNIRKYFKHMPYVWVDGRLVRFETFDDFSLVGVQLPKLLTLDKLPTAMYYSKTRINSYPYYLLAWVNLKDYKILKKSIIGGSPWYRFHLVRLESKASGRLLNIIYDACDRISGILFDTFLGLLDDICHDIDLRCEISLDLSHIMLDESVRFEEDETEHNTVRYRG